MGSKDEEAENMKAKIEALGECTALVRFAKCAGNRREERDPLVYYRLRSEWRLKLKAQHCWRLGMKGQCLEETSCTIHRGYGQPH